MSTHPPSRLLPLLFTAPVVLYRLRLGWLLGDRFILLTHTGRNSGRAHCAVLEVVGYDRSVPQVVVISAWGERAQWVRNLRAAPAISVQLGRHVWPAPAHRFLGPAQSATVIDAYRSAHPRATRMLARLLGWPADTAGADYEQWVQTLCGVAFTPAALSDST